MRARNLKPSLFRNDLLAVADPIYTVVFQGLWCMADRAGRLEDRPARIHFEINPGRAFETTERSLAWLADSGFIVRYAVDGRRFIEVVNFAKHQNPHHKEPNSVLPGPVRGESGASPGQSAQRDDVETPVESRADPSRAVLIPDSGSLIPDSGSPQPRSTERDKPARKRAVRVDESDSLTLHDSLPPDAWAEWLTRRRSRGWPMDALTLQKHLKLLARYSTDDQREIIDASIRSDWQGLFAPKGGRQLRPVSRFDAMMGGDEVANG